MPALPGLEQNEGPNRKDRRRGLPVDGRLFMVYTDIVFEWDDAKARSNALKHSIRFKEAAEAFNDPDALTVEDVAHSRMERRDRLIGDTSAGRLIVAVFTVRPGPAIRIISARAAGREERFQYERLR